MGNNEKWGLPPEGIVPLELEPVVDKEREFAKQLDEILQMAMEKGFRPCLAEAIDTLLGGLKGREFWEVWRTYGHSIRNLDKYETDADLVLGIWANTLDFMRATISEKSPYWTAEIVETLAAEPETRRRLRGKKAKRQARQTKKKVNKVINRIDKRPFSGLNNLTNFFNYYALAPLKTFLLALHRKDYAGAADIASEFAEEGRLHAWVSNWARGELGLPDK